MSKKARLEDVHELALAMPHATRYDTRDPDRPVYQVGGKSFVYFRTPRPDAVDPDTGVRYDDVIIFWVGSAEEKEAIVSDPSSPFFTTSHFDGPTSVLIRARDLGRISRDELAEVIQDAWLSRASKARAAKWLAEQGLDA